LYKGFLLGGIAFFKKQCRFSHSNCYRFTACRGSNISILHIRIWMLRRGDSRAVFAFPGYVKLLKPVQEAVKWLLCRHVLAVTHRFAYLIKLMGPGSFVKKNR